MTEVRNDDVRRILSLPVREFTDTEAREAAVKWTAALERKDRRALPNSKPLWPVQGAALESVHRNLQEHLDPSTGPFPYGPVGGFFPIGVGFGKTLVTLLVPEVVRRLRGSVRPMLVVPPDLVRKTELDHGAAARFYRYPTPRIVSMGVISHMNHSDVFERYAPDLILVDEAHKLASEESTRTKRLVRWVQENPETLCVFLSGTLTDKSIKDYRHLAELALRHFVPIPDHETDLELWQSVIDVGGQPNYAARKAVSPLVAWHTRRQGKEAPATGRIEKEDARQAFQARLRATPGVVGTSEAEVRCSLLIRPLKIELPSSWTEAAAEFTDEGFWELPEGEELENALEASRARAQLSSGYYTRWVWPVRACLGNWDPGRATWRGCTREDTCLCEGTGTYSGKDFEWLELRKAWKSRERRILKAIEQKTGQDSPALIRELARSGKLDSAARRSLAAWEAVKGRYYANGRVEPPTEYVDLTPGPEWLTQFARRWTRDKDSLGRRRGIIWYSTPHVGRALGAAGFTVFGRGTDLNELSADRVDYPAAKIDVQGTGKNLQGGDGREGWCRNLVLEFGGNGRTWEQMLGRNHRNGQLADEVEWDVLVDGGIRAEYLMSAKIGARYIESTMGTRQRLCYATYLPTKEAP